MILRLIFKLFSRKLTALALGEINKPKDFQGLKIQFIDSNKRKWYKYNDEFDMPIERKAYLEQIGQKLNYMMSDIELDKFINTLETLIHQSVYEKKIDAISRMATLISEVKRRKEILVNKELYYELLAGVYLREDENPAIVDMDIQEEKKEILKLEAKKQTNSYFFFDSLGLGEYISYFKKLRDNWDTEIIKSSQMLKESNEIMEWLTLGKKSSSQKQAGKKQK